jgi:hypothetical protein
VIKKLPLSVASFVTDMKDAMLSKDRVEKQMKALKK